MLVNRENGKGMSDSPLAGAGSRRCVRPAHNAGPRSAANREGSAGRGRWEISHARRRQPPQAPTPQPRRREYWHRTTRRITGRESRFFDSRTTRTPPGRRAKTSVVVLCRSCNSRRGNADRRQESGVFCPPRSNDIDPDRRAVLLVDYQKTQDSAEHHDQLTRHVHEPVACERRPDGVRP
jgi:hypothetical protein